MLFRQNSLSQPLSHTFRLWRRMWFQFYLLHSISQEMYVVPCPVLFMDPRGLILSREFRVVRSHPKASVRLVGMGKTKKKVGSWPGYRGRELLSGKKGHRQLCICPASLHGPEKRSWQDPKHAHKQLDLVTWKRVTRSDCLILTIIPAL